MGWQSLLHGQMNLNISYYRTRAMSAFNPLATFMEQSQEKMERKEQKNEEKDREEGLYEVLPQQMEVLRKMRDI